MLSKIFTFLHSLFANFFCFVFLDPWWCIFFAAITPLCFFSCVFTESAPTFVGYSIQFLVGCPIRMIYKGMHWADLNIRSFVFWNLRVKESCTHNFFFVIKSGNSESRSIFEFQENPTSTPTTLNSGDEILSGFSSGDRNNSQSISPSEFLQGTSINEGININSEAAQPNFEYEAAYSEANTVNSDAAPSNSETSTVNSGNIHEASSGILGPIPVSTPSNVPPAPPSLSSPSPSGSILGRPPSSLRPLPRHSPAQNRTYKEHHSRNRRNQTSVAALPLQPPRNQVTLSSSTRSGPFLSAAPSPTVPSSSTKALEAARKAAQAALSGLSKNNYAPATATATSRSRRNQRNSRNKY